MKVVDPSTTYFSLPTDELLLSLWTTAVETTKLLKEQNVVLQEH